MGGPGLWIAPATGSGPSSSLSDESLWESLKLGTLVRVPFGGNLEEAGGMTSNGGGMSLHVESIRSRSSELNVRPEEERLLFTTLKPLPESESESESSSVRLKVAGRFVPSFSAGRFVCPSPDGYHSGVVVGQRLPCTT